MADDKISLPSSGGGLIRYSEEYSSSMILSPQTIMVIIAVIIVLEIILHLYGATLGL